MEETIHPMTMDHGLSCSLISDNAAVAKERVHDEKFKGWPTPPGSSLGDLLYSPGNILSNFNLMLLCQNKVTVKESAK